MRVFGGSGESRPDLRLRSHFGPPPSILPLMGGGVRYDSFLVCGSGGLGEPCLDLWLRSHSGPPPSVLPLMVGGV
jgi:hypothetical protein